MPFSAFWRMLLTALHGITRIKSELCDGSACVDYAVDSGVLYGKKDNERGKIEYLQVPRG